MIPMVGGRGGPRAVILTVGDELLLGDRADTNARWIAAFLAELGFAVEGVLTVGDDAPRIAEALDWAVDRVHDGVVIMTGGLGPTTDDVSRESVAEWLGVALREEPSIRTGLEVHFRARGFAGLPRTNLRLTFVPEGAEILPNPSGTAPGLVLSLPATHEAASRSGLLFMLPGVPAEMEAIMRQEVAPRLDARFGERPVRPAFRILRTSGIPESALAEQLEPIVLGTPGLLVQYRPSWEGVELRVSTSEGEQALDRFMVEADPVLAPWCYGGQGSTLQAVVIDRLRALGWTLAVAESCTGGLLGARLTEVSGSSDVFLGGVVSYANAVKISVLGVPSPLLAAHGAVSEPVARQMAEGVVKVAEASVGISITGIAGPAGGSHHRPVGTVCFGLVSPATGTLSEQVRFPGGRDEIRHRAVQHALRLVDQAAAKGLRDEGSRSV